MSVTIREARDADADGLIALIGACWAEYPGCILDVDGEVPELRTIATAFSRRGGRFWVGEAAGRVVASVGILPACRDAGCADGAELCKLYVDRAQRRSGLGARLVALIEAEAAARGAAFVELWTDTRFADAHRLYERLGYVRSPGWRALHDLSNTLEYRYSKPLVGLRSAPAIAHRPYPAK